MRKINSLKKYRVSIFFATILLFSPVILLGVTTCYVNCTNDTGIEDGTKENPYKTISRGIQNASDGDTIKVLPGVYEESVTIDKSLILSGTGPDTTVIKGIGYSCVIVIENKNVTVEKLTLFNSPDDGITLKKSSSSVTVIINNVVASSNIENGLSQSEDCTCRVLANNCTFVANGLNGVSADDTSEFQNCIAANNKSYGFRNVDTYEYSTPLKIINCFSFANLNPYFNCDLIHSDDTINYTADPLFIDLDVGDYRLQSGSPCINKGTIGILDPDGTRSDIGAYGGPDSAGFYYGYGTGPIVTELSVVPASVPQGQPFTINATGKAQ